MSGKSPEEGGEKATDVVTVQVDAREDLTLTLTLVLLLTLTLSLTDVVTVQVDGEGGKAEEEPTPVQSESFLTYHFVMFILAVYTAMMFTDWGHPPEASRGHNQKYNQGFASAWLQMTANWMCSLLYLWTLVAPKLFPNRDFS